MNIINELNRRSQNNLYLETLRNSNILNSEKSENNFFSSK
jgi:hypothetical protein